MHSGFAALRSALPVNLKSTKPGFVVWSAAQTDIERILKIWQDCFARWKGPYLFGKKPTIADAMYALWCARCVRTYCVKLDAAAVDAYCERIMSAADDGRRDRGGEARTRGNAGARRGSLSVLSM